MKYIYTTIFLLFTGSFSFAQWTPNTAVNLEIAALNVADLQTVNTSSGKTWIAYYSNNAGNYDMRAQLLDFQGNKLLGPDGILVCNQTSGSATFVFNVCVDASDNLIIAFQYQVAGVNTAVITKVAQDGSLPWGSAGVQLGAGLAPYPALLTTGDIVVAWNNNSPATLYIQKISAGGAALWGSPVAVTVGASNTTRGQIVANPNGYFTMVMQRKGVGISTTLFSQRYNGEGVAQWVAPVQISTRTTSGARYYSILVDQDTTYFGYYASSGSRFFSHVQRINPDGTTPWGENGGNFSIYSTGSDPYQMTTNIGHYPGSSTIWATCTYSNTSQSQYGVYVQQFNTANGTAMLNPLGKEVFPISTDMNTQTGNIGFYGPDNVVFMTYDATYQMKISLLDAFGNMQWWSGFPEFLSSTTATLATPKGRFAFNFYQPGIQAVAVWYENRGIEYRAYAQARNLSVIPVTLTGFKAIKNNQAVDLSWNTATEANNKGFVVERSMDGVNYQQIGSVNSKAVDGNSSISLDYNFTDLHPLKSLNYYRLKQVDKDDKFMYSKTVLVRFDKAGNFIINNIYPQPAATLLNVSVDAVAKNKGTLSVIDMNGKTVKQIPIDIITGNNVYQLDISSVSKGMYLLKLDIEGNESVTEKWIKQ